MNARRQCRDERELRSPQRPTKMNYPPLGIDVDAWYELSVHCQMALVYPAAKQRAC